MSVTAAELACVAEELSRTLRGGRIRAIRGDRSWPERLLIRVQRDGSEEWLLVELDRAVARAHLCARPGPAPETPSAFVMLLRKHLDGAVIGDVRTEPGDRVLAIEVLGHGDTFELVVALRGARSDVALIGPDGSTLGTARGGVWPAESRDGDPPRAAALRVGFVAEAPSAWLDSVYAVEDARLLRERALVDARRRIRAAGRRLLGRLERIARDEAQVADAEGWKRRGELLQSARGRVPRGASSVVVHDWYADGAPEIRIELDPARSLEETIERCFHQYRRFTRGAATIRRRRAETEESLAALNTLSAAVENAADAAAVEAALQTASARRLLAGPPAQPPGGPRDVAPRQPYREVLSSDGFRILVGRGGADNDRLTFQIARGNDVWMHAIDWAGAHVVIALGGRPSAPQRTLEEAALLAAWNSRGRADSVVAVQWTQRKHVRKPKGVAPGRVSVAGGRTIEVRMDDPRLAALLDAGRVHEGA